MGLLGQLECAPCNHEGRGGSLLCRVSRRSAIVHLSVVCKAIPRHSLLYIPGLTLKDRVHPVFPFTLCDLNLEAV